MMVMELVMIVKLVAVDEVLIVVGLLAGWLWLVMIHVGGVVGVG